MKDSGHEARPFVIFHPALLLLVVSAALLRLALSLYFPRVVWGDESAYLLLGHNLVTGNGFTYTGYPELHFPPLHPLFVGLLSLMTGDLEMASNLENAIFGGLLLLPVFAIAVRIYGSQTAWLTAVLLALFPPLTVSVLYWGSMSEPPFLFLLFSALALFLAALEGQRFWMFFAAGAVLGLAYLTRDEAIAFCGALSIFALMWLWTEAKSLTLQVSWAVATFALSFLLVAAPYLWYLHVHTGQWMISGKLQITWRAGSYRDEGKTTQDQLYFGLDSSGSEVNWLSPERFQANMLSNVIGHPSVLLRRVVRTAGSLKENFFTRTNFWWALLPLVILGLFKQPWSRRRLRYEAFLLTMIAVLLVVFLPFGFLVRYFAPAFPILLMWTARGAQELGRWLQETVALSGGVPFSNRFVQAGLGFLPAGMAVLALLLTIPVTAERAISIMHFGDEEAGRWLKTHIPGDAKIMAQDVAVAVYSGRRWVPSPKTDWGRFMKYATAHGAQYLVVRDWKLEKSRPELAAVVRSGVRELELIYTFEEPHTPERITTFVYRLVKPHE
jgi:4-amino-4-deoxy-L-arabinose transferase-like glycosyltransferase